MDYYISCSKAEEAMGEVEFLVTRLQDSRDEITKTETEKNLVQRELELVRHGLQEKIAMNEIEQQNIVVARNR